MTGNGAVMKRRIKEGTGQFPMDCPMEDSHLQIHYRFQTLSSTVNMQLCTLFTCMCMLPLALWQATRKFAHLLVNVDSLEHK